MLEKNSKLMRLGGSSVHSLYEDLLGMHTLYSLPIESKKVISVCNWQIVLKKSCASKETFET
jgi:hypothetical protein